MKQELVIYIILIHDEVSISIPVIFDGLHENLVFYDEFITPSWFGRVKYNHLVMMEEKSQHSKLIFSIEIIPKYL